MQGEDRSVEKEIKELANSTGRALAAMPDQVRPIAKAQLGITLCLGVLHFMYLQVIQIILDCAVEVGAKVHMYAALVGKHVVDRVNLSHATYHAVCCMLAFRQHLACNPSSQLG